MLKRKVYNELVSWKENHKNKCLFVQGARQVGKTYIIREFGRREYSSYLEINFIRNESARSIFDGELSAEEIYKRLTLNFPKLKLLQNDTLIFLDEIQVCGNARTALKFLAEDGKYDVVASGSLLGLSYFEDADIAVEKPESIPVGYEDHITMYSLDFEEFLWANGYGEDKISILKGYFDRLEQIPLTIHEKFETLFREYMVIGGMPEVVFNYVSNKDFSEVSKIQDRIVKDYKFDISKHAKGVEKVKVNACYSAIPIQLAKELKKFQYSTVEKGKTSKKYGDSIQWLIDSSLVNPCYNISEPYIPLLANAKLEQFKLYINDTGLLCSMYGVETKKALIYGSLKGNAKGGIYENVIAELLVKKGYKLYYYKPDDNHELEFLLEKDGFVVPIEVKSTNSTTISLNNFIQDYKPKYVYKFVDSGIGKMEEKITIPHYMILFI